MPVQIALPLALCLLIIGCSTSERTRPEPVAYAGEIAKVELLKKGMTRAEVESTLKPFELPIRQNISGIEYEIYPLAPNTCVQLVYNTKSALECSLKDRLLDSPTAIYVLKKKGKQRWVEIPLVRDKSKR